MKILVDKAFFKNSNFLIVENDHVRWSCKKVSDFDCYISVGEDELSRFSSAFSIEKPEFFDNSIKKMCETLNIKSPSISKMLPSSFYNKKIKNLEKYIAEVKNLLTLEKYAQNYLDGNSILNNLEKILVDKDSLKNIIKSEQNPTVKSTLKSFFPAQDDYCHKIRYNRNKTVTGRLVVESGPQVLLLPKKNKNIFKSRYQNGKIIWVDFISLEPRFTKLLFSSETEKDLYSQILESVSLDLSREQVKIAVLSIIFGAGLSKLTETFGRDALLIKKKISSFFKLEDVLELIEKSKKEEYRNYFGRPLKIKKKAKNVLINNYIQSSSVDVSLMGFSKLIKSCENIRSLKPLAVVHDALVLDIKESELEDFKQIINKGIDLKDLGKFYLGVETYER